MAPPTSMVLSILVPVPTSTDIEAPVDLFPDLPALTPAQLIENRSGMIHWSCGATLLCSTIAFIGRLYSRRMTQAGVLFSDWILFIGTFCSFALASVQLARTRHGLGRHLQVVLEEDPKLGTLEQALKARNSCIEGQGAHLKDLPTEGLAHYSREPHLLCYYHTSVVYGSPQESLR